MFCTKCGKPTENNQPICNDCLQAMNGAQAQPQQAYQQPQYQQPQYQPQYQQPQQAYYAPQAPKAPALTKPTLGKAIAGLILASVALFVLTYVFFYVEANLSYYSNSYYDYYYGYYYNYGGYYYYNYTVESLVMIILMLPPSIIGLTFGAKSIGGSNMVLADGTRKKHIATLILGIAALIIGISAVCMSGVSFYSVVSWW